MSHVLKSLCEHVCNTLLGRIPLLGLILELFLAAVFPVNLSLKFCEPATLSWWPMGCTNAGGQESIGEVRYVSVDGFRYL